MKLLAICLVLPLALQEGESSNWPSFRGERARGVADGYATPDEWELEDELNVLWRTPIPGLAHSSPIVWGAKLFVTTAEKVEGEAELSSLYGSPGYGAGESVENEGPHAFQLYCLDKLTGEILWERTAHEGVPKVKRHPKSSHANSTPACDAERVVAFFGSEGLHCYDHDGKLLWSRDFGVLDAGAPGISEPEKYQWGFASSPVLHEGSVIVQCDVQDQSFLTVLDAKDGSVHWRVDRDEDPSWCTPTVIDAGAGGKPQIVLNGYKHIGGYDLATGEEVWKLVGGGDVPVPTPVVGHDLIFLTSAHGRMRPIYAIKRGAQGLLNIDPDECADMAWSYPRAGVYMQTPLVYGDYLYLNSDGGVLSCYDAKTGKRMYKERVGDGANGFSGSPVAADGKIYLSGESGQVVVVNAGPELDPPITNDLGETCMATPAVSEGRLYFRTRNHVIALANEE